MQRSQHQKLFIEIGSNLVYKIPASVFEARERRLEDKSCFTDLATGQQIAVPTAEASGFMVPDQRVGFELRFFRISGLRKPYRFAPNLRDSEIPLQGNLTDPAWASVSIGGSCNSRCVFCYTQWLRKFPDFSLDMLKSAVDRIASIGSVKTLVFSGGEASIRPDLVELIRYAQSAGFTAIGLQTNGRGLTDLSLVQKLTECGLGRVLLSLHGPNSQIHDKITRSKGSFGDAVRALENLILCQVEIEVNVVVCIANCTHLQELVKFLIPYRPGCKNIRLSYPIVEGAAHDNVEQVLVKLSKLRKDIAETIALARYSGFAIELANLPPCIPHSFECAGSYDAAALSAFVEASPFYKWNVKRGERSVKLASCIRCLAFNKCRGIQIEYLLAFPTGHEDFKPILS